MRTLAACVLVIFMASLVLVVRAAADPIEPPTTIQGRDITRWRELALERDKTARLQARTIRRLRRHVAEPLSPPRIICAVFRDACREALAVAWCESRFDPGARNGQFRGLFQMGSGERARYGHGPDALTQALAARAYFLDAGWRPWACKP